MFGWDCSQFGWFSRLNASAELKLVVPEPSGFGNQLHTACAGSHAPFC
jgi:hypothetical protein